MEKMMAKTEKDDKLEVGEYFYINSDEKAPRLNKKEKLDINVFVLKKLPFMDVVHIKFGIFKNECGKDIYRVVNITKYQIESTLENL